MLHTLKAFSLNASIIEPLKFAFTYFHFHIRLPKNNLVYKTVGTTILIMSQLKHKPIFSYVLNTLECPEIALSKIIDKICQSAF